MDTKACITGRRSVRKYEARQVPRALLEELIGLAAYAPSWKNTQISRYLAIRDPELKGRIAREFTNSHNADIINSCPTLLVQTFRKARSGFERDGSYSTDRGEGWQPFDCGVAAQTLCLAAHELGLATVIMGVFDRKGLERALEIPEEQEIMCLIALGYPDQAPPAPKRKDVETLLTVRE